MVKKRKIRTAVVLKEVEVPFDKIKKGQIFRLKKCSKSDKVDENQWAKAITNSYKDSFGTPTVICYGVVVVSVKSFEKIKETHSWGSKLVQTQYKKRIVPKSLHAFSKR